MDSVEQQLGVMSKEFGARSNVTVVLESVFFSLIILLLFVGNFDSYRGHNSGKLDFTSASLRRIQFFGRN